MVPSYLVRRAIRQAEFMGLRLDGIETNRARSDLEEEFLRLCALHGLPAPEVNAKVGRWEVDFLWRQQGQSPGASLLTSPGLLARRFFRSR